MEFKDKSIDAVLNIRAAPGAYPVYHVPFLQRAYAWEDEERNIFCEDIDNNDLGYFLGTMVCVRCKDDQSQEGYEVIDGQQRLMSISLIFAAIYKKLQEMEKEGNEKINGGKVDGLADFMDEIRKRLVLIDDKNSTTGILRLHPSTQKDDYKAYEYIIGDLGILKAGKSPKPDKEGLVLSGFAGFHIWLEEKIKEDLEEIEHNRGDLSEVLKHKKSALKNFSDKLLAASVVIILPSGQNSNTLFKALNNRGIPLTSLDIIKNDMFGYLKKEKSDLHKCLERWNGILENLGDSFEVSERFLRHHYMIQSIFRPEIIPKGTQSSRWRGKVLPASQIIRSYEAVIENIGESGIKNATVKFLNEIDIYSTYYKKIILEDIDPEAPNKENIGISKRLYCELSFLKQTEGVPSHLLLLYLFKRKDEERDVKEKDIEDAVACLRQFFLCVRMIGFWRTNKQDDLFWGLVQKLRKCERREIVRTIGNTLKRALFRPDEKFDESFFNKSVSPDDREDADLGDEFNQNFYKKITGSIYGSVNTKSTIRLMLFYLQYMHYDSRPEGEKDLMWIKNMGNLRKREERKKIWSIEHILPQGKKLPSYWVTEIEDGNEDPAKVIQERCMHKLGNLTITGQNQTLGNKKFDIKKEKLADSNLSINKDIITSARWREKEINARTEKLARDFIDSFFDKSSFGRLVEPPESSSP